MQSSLSLYCAARKEVPIHLSCFSPLLGEGKHVFIGEEMDFGSNLFVRVAPPYNKSEQMMSVKSRFVACHTERERNQVFLSKVALPE